MKTVYLLLAIIGAVVPYYFFIAFLTQHGLDMPLMVSDLFANPISTFFAADLLMSCVIFVVYLRREAERLRMHGGWIFVVVLLVVGLSCALPLFLYARESYIAGNMRQAGA